MTPTTDAGSTERQSLEAFRAGRFEEAAAGFEVARRAYEAAGEPLKQAEMANNQSVAWLQAGRPQAALAAVKGTPEMLAALGDDSRAAQAYGNLAAALEACGDLANAEPAYQEAADRFEKLGDAENRALTMKALSQLQMRRGRPMQALGSMQAGLGGASRLSTRQRFLRWLLTLPGKFLGR